MNNYKVFLLLPILMLLFSCDEETITENSNNGISAIAVNPNTLNFIDSIGNYHNNVVRHLHDVNLPHNHSHEYRFIDANGNIYLKRSSFDNMEEQIIDYYDIMSWDTTNARNDIANVKTVYSNLGYFGTFDSVDYVKQVNLLDYIDEMENLLMISSYEHDKIYDIATEAINGDKSKIDSIFNSINLDSLYNLDELFLPKAKGIFDSSYVYWNDHLNPSIPTATRKILDSKLADEVRNKDFENVLIGLVAGVSDVLGSGPGSPFISVGVGLAASEYFDSQWCTCHQCGKEYRCDD